MQQAGDVCVGEINPLELAVKQSKEDIGRVEAARATVNQVKVDGIGTNLVIMQELLFPLVGSFKTLQFLASWKEPSKSTVFLVLVTYIILGGLDKYVLPSVFIFVAVMMSCNRYANYGKPLEAFNITAPPSQSAVEQLLALQEIISGLEALLQAADIFLLKVRALLLAAVPEVFTHTDFILMNYIYCIFLGQVRVGSNYTWLFWIDFFLILTHIYRVRVGFRVISISPSQLCFRVIENIFLYYMFSLSRFILLL